MSTSNRSCVLLELRAAGLVLSLDDFGTGYASFARLRDMPFSLLKTDLSFMRRVPDDETAVELLHAMVTLGKTLGLVVIVEGVETERQLEHVLDIGVRVAQGHPFARALPPDEIEARYGPAARVGQEAEAGGRSTHRLGATRHESDRHQR